MSTPNTPSPGAYTITVYRKDGVPHAHTVYSPNDRTAVLSARGAYVTKLEHRQEGDL
jgi:hypothetical protein